MCIRDRRKIVQEADPAFLQPFIDAAVGLARDGAALISTSCGFLARYQDALQAAVPVPVAVSYTHLGPDAQAASSAAMEPDASIFSAFMSISKKRGREPAPDVNTHQHILSASIVPRSG